MFAPRSHAEGAAITRDLRQRVRRHGTRSKYAGDEPRNREIVEHWPEKRKRQSAAISKRETKRRRKEEINKRAAEAAYQARLTAPWPIYVCAQKGA
jgi:hypothetical protein